MKFTVSYQTKKKKGTSKQEATFLKVEDAIMWEKYALEKGATDVKILVC